jgi:recombination protein RecA
MGQGKENAKEFLAENPDIAHEIEERLRVALNMPSAAGSPSEDGTPSPEPVDEASPD